jgi:hypothetical protein
MGGTKENNFFSKIKNFFDRLFEKREKFVLSEGTANIQETKNNFIETLRKSTLIKDAYILNLQQDFEDGNIKEQDISEEDKIKLKELYKEQISNLRKSISSYKTRILKLKNT